MIGDRAMQSVKSYQLVDLDVHLALLSVAANQRRECMEILYCNWLWRKVRLNWRRSVVSRWLVENETKMSGDTLRYFRAWPSAFQIGEKFWLEMGLKESGAPEPTTGGNQGVK